MLFVRREYSDLTHSVKFMYLSRIDELTVFFSSAILEINQTKHTNYIHPYTPTPLSELELWTTSRVDAR